MFVCLFVFWADFRIAIICHASPSNKVHVSVRVWCLGIFESMVVHNPQLISTWCPAFICNQRQNRQVYDAYCFQICSSCDVFQSFVDKSELSVLRWWHITLFLEDGFSFTSRLRLWSTKTAPLFFLCTALRDTFQVELWFLNPVWRTRKKNCSLRAWNIVFCWRKQ